jgi:hypothetical protein
MDNKIDLNLNYNKIDTKMDFYMYKYSCSTWLGTYNNINHIVVNPKTSENDVKEIAKNISNNHTGSQNCDINLLQKYKMIILPEKCYPTLPNLTFYKN